MEEVVKARYAQAPVPVMHPAATRRQPSPCLRLCGRAGRATHRAGAAPRSRPWRRPKPRSGGVRLSRTRGILNLGKWDESPHISAPPPRGPLVPCVSFHSLLDAVSLRLIALGTPGFAIGGRGPLYCIRSSVLFSPRWLKVGSADLACPGDQATHGQLPPLPTPTTPPPRPAHRTAVRTCRSGRHLPHLTSLSGDASNFAQFTPP